MKSKILQIIQKNANERPIGPVGDELLPVLVDFEMVNASAEISEFVKDEILKEIDDRILGIGERSKGKSKDFKLKSEGAQTSLTVLKMWIGENI